jgi:hypothetical protein
MFSIDRHDPPRNPFEQLYIVARAINGVEDFNHPAASAAIQMFIDEGSLPVWLSVAGSKRLIHPRQELAAVVMDPTAAQGHLFDQAMAWRKRLGLK